MYRVIPIALLFSFLLAPAAEPQATVKALARNLEPLEETTDIRLTRFADFTDEPAVRVDMELEPGDLLASGPGDVTLELECPGGSLLRFSDSFRVLVDVPGDGVDCAVNFLSGTVDVLADQPTEIQAGGVVLGSEGTQYTVELVRQAQKPDVDCQVYDGRVAWRFSKGKAERPSHDPRAWPASKKKTRWLSAGNSIRVADRKTQRTQISARQRSRTAWRYARFDIMNARARGMKISDEETATRELVSIHEKVLARPKDTQLRVDLAKTQIRYSLPSQANYNLRVVGVRTEAQLRSYQIDAGQLQAAPKTKTFSPSVRLPPASLKVPPVSQPGLQPAAAPEPWTLVRQGKLKEAVEAGQKKVEAGSATSRDYYALALALRELEGQKSRGAAVYAHRAVELHKKDGQLSDRELETCTNVARGR